MTRPLPSLPDHPEPVNGYWTSRRAQQQARRRSRTVGVWLQYAGAAVMLAMAVWFTVGDALVGRWQQQTLRAEMAAQLAAPSPAAAPPAATPAFGLGGTAGSPVQVSMIQLPGEELDDAPAEPVSDHGHTSDTPAGQPPAAGSYRLRAPAIDLDWVAGSGVSVADLRAGPGWMPGTATPGQAGNTVFSGHRTTYGAPFARIDELATGDEIIVDLPGGGQAVYEVRDAFATVPAEIGVAYPTDGARLTLTTCTPTGSARYRLVVQAEQVAGPAVDLAVAADDWVAYDGTRYDDDELLR